MFRFKLVSYMVSFARSRPAASGQAAVDDGSEA